MPLKTAFLLLATLCCITIAADTTTTESNATKCKDQYGLNDSEFYELQTLMLAKDESIESQRCFIVCLLTEEDAIKNGEFDIDKFVEDTKADFAELNMKVNEALFRQELLYCVNKVSDKEGTCMKNYYIWKCVLDILHQGVPTE